MASFTYCELCGEVIDDERQEAATLEFLGEKFDYHAPWCARRVLRMLGDASKWALGDGEGVGLAWELVDNNEKYADAARAVLRAQRKNRILALCRERGINRDELAEQLGTGRGAVGRWLKSYLGQVGAVESDRWHPEGISERWLQRLVVFFDVDSRDDLFERQPSGDAPADEFVEVR